jgi:hypothetical protein
MLDDRLVDGEVEPLDVGQLLLGHPGELIAVFEDGDVAAARRLLGAQRIDDAAARLVGPVGARLDHAAGCQRADGDVRPEDEQLVIALRRRELQVGILLGLHASGQRKARRKRGGNTGSTHRSLSTGAHRAPLPSLYVRFHA